MEQARLLLVDDDPGTIQVLGRMLAAYRNLRFATSGADALRLARESVPDLILLDAEMPGMSGFEVYRALKAEPALAAVPVIFATSHLQAAMNAAALEAGAVDFVPKPLVAAQVLARVQAQLSRRAAASPPPPPPVAPGERRRRLDDARVAAIVDALSEAVVTFDARGAVVLINRAACAMFRTDAEQAIGHPVAALVPAAAVAVAARRASGRERWRALRTDGAAFEVEASLSSLGDGDERLATLTMRDADAAARR